MWLKLIEQDHSYETNFLKWIGGGFSQIRKHYLPSSGNVLIHWLVNQTLLFWLIGHLWITLTLTNYLYVCTALPSLIGQFYLAPSSIGQLLLLFTEWSPITALYGHLFQSPHRFVRRNIQLLWLATCLFIDWLTVSSDTDDEIPRSNEIIQLPIRTTDSASSSDELSSSDESEAHQVRVKESVYGVWPRLKSQRWV